MEEDRITDKKIWICKYMPVWCISLFAFLILVTGLQQQPQLYPADYGQYEQYMRQCGLKLKTDDQENENIFFTHAITEYDYKHISVMKLLTPVSESAVPYAVAIVRLFTEPFGKPFSGNLLALVWIFILTVSVTVVSLYLFRMFRHGWWIPGVIFCLIFSDKNFTAILRGLYPQSGSIVLTLVYLGTVLHTVYQIRQGRNAGIILLSIISAVFIKSSAMMLVFIPFVVFFWIYAGIRQIKQRLVSPVRFFIALFLLVTGIVGAARSAMNDTDYFSAPALYESTFHVLLPNSEHPKEVLSDLGLDDSYLEDIGMTYYAEASAYRHPPADEEEAAVLSAHLSVPKIIRSYLKHPGTLLRAVMNIPNKPDTYRNERNVASQTTQTDYSEKRADAGFYAWARYLLPYNWIFFAVFSFIISAAVIVFSILRRKGIWLSIPVFLFCAVLYLPACVIFNGYSLSAEYILCQVWIMDVFWIFIWMVLCKLAYKFHAWLFKYSGESSEVDPALADFPEGSVFRDGWDLPDRIRDFIIRVCASRRSTLIVVAAAAVLMSLMTLLRNDRAGCVNNGDFGRMMSSIDLNWTREAEERGTELHWVIEEYDWKVPFNWKRLTPLKPSYSLYFFASLSRLLTEPLGKPMNTFVLEWVMTAFAIASILLIVNDLYKLLKKFTLLFGLLLCTLFLSETTLSWYNGLFGEGTVILGLMLSCACAVHIAVMPRKGAVRRIIWFGLLTYSLYILTTSKAQMLLALPFALVLLTVLVIFHWPRKLLWRLAVTVGLLTAVAFIAVGTYLEYSGERNESSGAQMHTMWQAYFYGIFMISDDPIADMEELGIDTAMAVDIGKFVDFSEDAEYLYHPLSKEAKEKFTDHVSTGKIIIWYLKHPSKMIYMLDHAAEVTRQIYTGFRAYKSQDYWDWVNRDTVDGMGLWMYWRESMVPGSFFGYLIFYLCLLGGIGYLLVSRRKTVSRAVKMLCYVVLFIAFTGVFQYPLSVLGNGFADNHKQLFVFSLCHDLLLLIMIVIIFRWVCSHSFDSIPKLRSIMHTKGSGGTRRIIHTIREKRLES